MKRTPSEHPALEFNKAQRRQMLVWLDPSRRQKCRVDRYGTYVDEIPQDLALRLGQITVDAHSVDVGGVTVCEELSGERGNTSPRAPGL